MRLPSRQISRAAWILALAGCAAWASSTMLAGRAAADAPAQTRAPVEKPPVIAPAHPQESEIKDLEGRLRTLREELHSQVDVLQSQVKALHEKYDPQIQTLEDQKKSLIESGKSPAIQQLDKQEEAELASLEAREKGEIEKVHEQTAAERKEIQQKYDALRKQAHS